MDTTMKRLNTCLVLLFTLLLSPAFTPAQVRLSSIAFPDREIIVPQSRVFSSRASGGLEITAVDVRVEVIVEVKKTGTKKAPQGDAPLHLIEAAATIHVVEAARNKPAGAFKEKYSYGFPVAELAEQKSIENLAARIRQKSVMTIDRIIKARPLR